MHLGLNRDIKGEISSTLHPPIKTDNGVAFSQGISHNPAQLLQQWQSSKHEEIKSHTQDQQSSTLQVNQCGPSSDSQHLPNHTFFHINHDPIAPNRSHDQQYVHMSQSMNMQNTDNNPAQNITRNLDYEYQLQRRNNQQDVTTGMSLPAGIQVEFGMLLPAIQSQLDKDRAMQLQVLYNQLMAPKLQIMQDLIHPIRMHAGGPTCFTTNSPNSKTPSKKSTVDQKKPFKKQKVFGSFSDHYIEQLNDVIDITGVDLWEEEKQLFSGSKKNTRVSEASRKIVQEEEKKLFLQKIPLQKKVAEIMAKCGVNNKSNNVDRCLSLCVEARMHGLVNNLIRLSKQRVNIEKQRHRTVITSDILQQIMSLNQKAREEREEKQADADKLQTTDEVNKEKIHKIRIAAANVAVREAVGGVDMMAKWKLMAEQACQKREGGRDAASAFGPSVDVGLGPKPTSTSEKKSNKVNPNIERNSSSVIPTPGPIRKTIRNQDLGLSGDRVSLPRTITVQDVISVLERDSDVKIHANVSSL